MAPTCLLIAIGFIGAFDIAYFHAWRAALTKRPECRAEATVHVIRGFVYGAQFLIIPNMRLLGAWYFAQSPQVVEKIEKISAPTRTLSTMWIRYSVGGRPPCD